MAEAFTNHFRVLTLAQEVRGVRVPEAVQRYPREPDPLRDAGTDFEQLLGFRGWPSAGARTRPWSS